MLTIADLSTHQALDMDAMSDVRGGSAPTDLSSLGDSFSVAGIVNAPQIDLGAHLLLQKQAVAVDQSGNIGGLNLVFSDQTQNGIAGQVAV